MLIVCESVKYILIYLLICNHCITNDHSIFPLQLWYRLAIVVDAFRTIRVNQIVSLHVLYVHDAVVVLLIAIENRPNIHFTTIVCLHATLVYAKLWENCRTVELTSIAQRIYCSCQPYFTAAAVKYGVYNYCKSNTTLVDGNLHGKVVF